MPGRAGAATIAVVLHRVNDGDASVRRGAVGLAPATQLHYGRCVRTEEERRWRESRWQEFYTGKHH